MKGKRNWIVLLLSCFVLALVAGCGSQSAGSGGGNIIYISHVGKASFTGKLFDAVQKQAEGKGLTAEFEDANKDANAQIDLMNEAIAKKPAAIVITPTEGKALVPAIQKANKASIPVVVANRDIAEGADCAKVYSDDKQAGKMQGEYMAKHLKQGAKVVYLMGAGNQKSSHARFDGFKEACLDKRPDIELVASADGDWRETEGMKYVSLWLMTFPEIDAVVAGNDDMALGALRALKAAGRADGVLISGVDAGERAVKAVAAGEMAQTVKQDADGNAVAIVETIQKMLTGGQSTDTQYVPFIELTKDNVAQYMK